MGGPALLSHGDCCAPCDEPLIVQVPGIAGAPGVGTNGANGSNAYTTLTANFTVPAVDATAVADVGSSSWITIGQILFLQLAGYFEATAKPTSTQVTLKNLGYAPNVLAGTVIPTFSQLSPSGLQGPQSAADVAALLNEKVAARAATTANIALSGLQTIDGVVLVAGDRVLAKNQSAPLQNGLYVVSAGGWARTSDASVSTEVTSGMRVWVMEGTTQNQTCWLLTTLNPITLETTSLTFTLCGSTTGRMPWGTVAPNGVVTGSRGDTYYQIPGDGTITPWLKITDGVNTGWV